MTVRSSMANLITRTRRYIGDPSGATEHFADQDVQDALDEHRFTVRYADLRPGPTLAPGALYDYLDYYADVGQWEDDVVLQWNDYSTLTPITSDTLSGHWTFNNSLGITGVFPVVRITGKYYDLHATAADLLEQWAAALATAYSFTADGLTLNRSQMSANLLRSADAHRAKAYATSTRVTRVDVLPDQPPLSVTMGGTGDATDE